MMTKERVLNATKQNNKTNAIDFASSQRANVNNQVKQEFISKKPKNT